jgi:putative transposase
MNEQAEYQLRRKALRLALRGQAPQTILRQIPRSRTWLHKWRQRFLTYGWAGLKSQPRQPHHRPHALAPSSRQLVIRARRVLEQRQIGLIGPAAIQAELRSWPRVGPIPSTASIKRILRAAGLSKAAACPVKAPYFPQPTPTEHYALQARDWTARYLPGGVKVFAFHSIDVQSRAIKQTIARDKSVPTVRAHLLAAWQRLGLPDGLQMDNDSAFNGGTKVHRVFGQIVRLCLYVGVEPIFIPVSEPKRNGLVESLNGLWSRSFWRRRHFTRFAQVVAGSPAFEDWYARQYHPPGLHGRTPWQAQRQQSRTRLRAQQARVLGASLPITAGRVHFIRLVDAAGQIGLLNETWRVSKRLAGEYVWATIVTHRGELRIYHRASGQGVVRLVKRFAYPLAEPIMALSAEFRRPQRRRNMFTML